MAEFTPIETQEALDAIITKRLEQKERSVRNEYADYDDLKKQSQTWEGQKTAFEKQIAENKTAYDDLNAKYTAATGKVAELEAGALRTKVAIDAGLPMNLCSYLKGSTEEEIKASAAELAKFAGEKMAAPLANPEGIPGMEDGKKAAVKQLFKEMKGDQ